MSQSALVVVPTGATLDAQVVGGKAANLAVLGALGLRVPPWFAVTADAFGLALAEAGVDLTAGESGAIAARVAELRPTGALEGAIRDAYTRVFGQSAEVLVAVRSSAVGEDSATHSFAGQLDSFLYVRGVDEVLEVVARCWASGFGARAVAYRQRHGLPLAEVRVGVIIQQMAPGRVSGVLFTANPVNGQRDEAVVSAVYGLGDGLVSGALAADHWTVTRQGAIRAELVPKRVQLVHDEARGRGTACVPVPADWQQRPALTDEQLRELVALGDRVADRAGAPQDIEWTLDDQGFVLLQSRPITALAPPLAGGRRLWDCSNIAESYPGVSAPLTFSFVRTLYAVAYQVLLLALGIRRSWLAERQEIFENLLGYLHGRIYYNLSSYELLNTFFPARDAIREYFGTMIGVKERKAFGERRVGTFAFLFQHLPQLLALVARVLWRFVRWDAEVADFEAYFARTFARFAAPDYQTLPPDEVLANYRALERELLWKWCAPMVNDFFAMVFFGVARSLATRWELDVEGGLVNDLLRAQGGLASAAPAEALAELAALVRQDAELTALYEMGSDTEVAAALAAGRFSAYAAAFGRYLDRYGYRCMGELKLEVPNLRDEPLQAHALVRGYLRHPGPDRATREAREKAIAEETRARLDRGLAGHPLRRWIFGWVVANARKGVRLREQLRMARTNVFGLVRAMFLGLGRHLHAHGALDAAQDVFMLDLNELFAFLEGRATTLDLRALVALRGRELAEFAKNSPPDALETAGSPYLGDQLAPATPAEAAGGNTLAGIGCSAGKVAGVSRVVHDPAAARLSGEILVAERTDPGWVLLYPLASGLLVEHGSLLSHAAVTARELGLPAVVGVKGLMRRVKDGQWLELDGRTGVVTLGPEEPTVHG